MTLHPLSLRASTVITASDVESVGN